MGERADALRAERRRELRRRLPALPGDRARVRLGKEGAPTTPTVRPERAPRGASRWPRSSAARRPAAEPVAPEPILRRLSEHELAIVEAADLFNASPYRRTVAGIAKSLGDAAASSIVPLSGVNADVVVTVAWDISWYQYRVAPDVGAAGAPRRARPRARASSRAFTTWNAHLETTAGSSRHRAPVISAWRDGSYTEPMIYCVIPRELADELYDKLVEHYEDNPNVTVIVDRRDGPDRRRGKDARRGRAAR